MFTAETLHDPILDTDIVRLQYAPPGQKGMVVEIAPALGSNMYRWRYGEHEVWVGDKELLKTGYWTGNFVLWPIPNRVSKGADRTKGYVFEGRKVVLEEIERKEGNKPLVHGLVDDQPWEVDQPVVDDTAASVTTRIQIVDGSPMLPYYPYPSQLSLTYRLTERGMRVGYQVDNQGEANMPFGFALHPYFATLSGLDRTLVELPADSVMETDDELLPTGVLIPMGEQGYDLRRPTPVGALALDHVFTDLDPSRPPSIHYTSLGFKLNLNHSPDFTHMVLYTEKAAEKGFICFENQTSATDAINLHERAIRQADERLKQAAHLMILGPGQTHQGYIEYEIQQAA